MGKPVIFSGSGTAIITPFRPEGVDYIALGRLIAFQLAEGTDAVIVCGTTGEASTMSYVERMRVIESTVRQVDGQVPVIAGTGSNSTENAVVLSRDAALAGVDGVLVVTPYYNKATQAGLIRHYCAIADSVDLPVMAYHVPSRTGVRIQAETYLELSRHPNLIGVKEASGNFALVQKTRRLCGDQFHIWSGNDEDTAGICMLGGKGVISVAANVMPRRMHELTEACFQNDYSRAGEMQIALQPLIQALFSEVNPIPVKTALAMMGYCQEQFRLPLCGMSPENRERLKTTLCSYGLLG